MVQIHRMYSSFTRQVSWMLWRNCHHHCKAFISPLIACLGMEIFVLSSVCPPAPPSAFFFLQATAESSL